MSLSSSYVFFPIILFLIMLPDRCGLNRLYTSSPSANPKRVLEKRLTVDLTKRPIVSLNDRSWFGKK